MTGLSHVESSSHVAFAKFNKTFHGIRRDFNLLLLNDLINQNTNILLL